MFLGVELMHKLEADYSYCIVDSRSRYHIWSQTCFSDHRVHDDGKLGLGKWKENRILLFHIKLALGSQLIVNIVVKCCSGNAFFMQYNVLFVKSCAKDLDYISQCMNTHSELNMVYTASLTYQAENKA